LVWLGGSTHTPPHTHSFSALAVQKHSRGAWGARLKAAVIPLVLTMVLFAGPLYYEWLTMVERRSYFKALGALVSLLEEKSTSLIFWRNCIVV